MTGMFDNATSFEQNLCRQCINLNSTAISRAAIPWTVGTVSTQNAFLASQNSTYGIAPGTDEAGFAVSGATLATESATPDKSTYLVNATASGPSTRTATTGAPSPTP